MTAVTFTPITGPAGGAATTAQLKVAQPEPLLSRTYYQDGRLLTAADLNRDQAYLDRRLRDLGLSLGDGVARGLLASLAGSVITVTPGAGIAPSGRAIATDAALSADLADIGLQASLNGAGFSGLADGLYAVVLLHGEQASGVAEVFPRDLSRRRAAYATIVDTVEIALVGLPHAVPGGNAFQARAQLAPGLAFGLAAPGLLQDSLPLGVVAMQRGLPAWFDMAMLRHPLRAPDLPTAAADDLAAQYAGLYADLMADLALAGTASFRAADVFTLLPATGLLPRAAIDPVAASQTFFPEQIDVVMAPARTDEVADILAQARAEPPIDLVAGGSAQVLVLVPLAPAAYAALTPALASAGATPAAAAFKPYPSLMLPRIDALMLRLPGRWPVASTPQDAWANIWQRAPTALPWMVRPTDGGIGGVAVGLLAAGYAVPVAPVVAPVMPMPMQPGPVLQVPAMPFPGPTLQLPPGVAPAPPTAQPEPTPTPALAPGLGLVGRPILEPRPTAATETIAGRPIEKLI